MSLIKKHSLKNSKKGFTLIELLIVVAILGLLATVVFVNLNPTANIADANNAKRVSDIAAIKTALSQLQLAGGTVPATAVSAVTGIYTPAVLSPYLSIVPVDPSSKQYAYCRGANVASYALGIDLDATATNNRTTIMTGSTTSLPAGCTLYPAASVTCEAPGAANNGYCTRVGS